MQHVVVEMLFKKSMCQASLGLGRACLLCCAFSRPSNILYHYLCFLKKRGLRALHYRKLPSSISSSSGNLENGMGWESLLKIRGHCGIACVYVNA